MRRGFLKKRIGTLLSSLENQAPMPSDSNQEHGVIDVVCETTEPVLDKSSSQSAVIEDNVPTSRRTRLRFAKPKPNLSNKDRRPGSPCCKRKTGMIPEKHGSPAISSLSPPVDSISNSTGSVKSGKTVEEPENIKTVMNIGEKADEIMVSEEDDNILFRSDSNQEHGVKDVVCETTEPVLDKSSSQSAVIEDNVLTSRRTTLRFAKPKPNLSNKDRRPGSSSCKRKTGMTPEEHGSPAVSSLSLPVDSISDSTGSVESGKIVDESENVKTVMNISEKADEIMVSEKKDNILFRSDSNQEHGVRDVVCETTEPVLDKSSSQSAVVKDNVLTSRRTRLRFAKPKPNLSNKDRRPGTPSCKRKTEMIPEELGSPAISSLSQPVDSTSDSSGSVESGKIVEESENVKTVMSISEKADEIMVSEEENNILFRSDSNQEHGVRDVVCETTEPVLDKSSSQSAVVKDNVPSSRRTRLRFAKLKPNFSNKDRRPGSSSCKRKTGIIPEEHGSPAVSSLSLLVDPISNSTGSVESGKIVEESENVKTVMNISEKADEIMVSKEEDNILSRSDSNQEHGVRDVVCETTEPVFDKSSSQSAVIEDNVPTSRRTRLRFAEPKPNLSNKDRRAGSPSCKRKTEMIPEELGSPAISSLSQPVDSTSDSSGSVESGKIVEESENVKTVMSISEKADEIMVSEEENNILFRSDSNQEHGVRDVACETTEPVLDKSSSQSAVIEDNVPTSRRTRVRFGKPKPNLSNTDRRSGPPSCKRKMEKKSDEKPQMDITDSSCATVVSKNRECIVEDIVSVAKEKEIGTDWGKRRRRFPCKPKPKVKSSDVDSVVQNMGQRHESDNRGKLHEKEPENDSVCGLKSSEAQSSMKERSDDGSSSEVKSHKKKCVPRKNSLSDKDCPDKRRGKRKVQDRENLTMHDLIYWNPCDNPMKSTSIDKVQNNTQDNSPVADSVEDNTDCCLPEIPEQTDEHENVSGANTVHGPQVIIGADGEITVDESSLVVHRTVDTENLDTVTVCEDASATYSSFRTKPNARTWDDKETKKFYKALSTVGTDFTLMSELFGNRTRRELKLKYKREERHNRRLVDRALDSPPIYNLEMFHHDGDGNPEGTDQGENAKNTKKTKKRRRRATQDQNGGVDSDVQQSPRKKQKCTQRRSRKKYLVSSSDEDTLLAELVPENGESKESENTNSYLYAEECQHEKDKSDVSDAVSSTVIELIICDDDNENAGGNIKLNQDETVLLDGRQPSVSKATNKTLSESENINANGIEQSDNDNVVESILCSQNCATETVQNSVTQDSVLAGGNMLLQKCLLSSNTYEENALMASAENKMDDVPLSAVDVLETVSSVEKQCPTELSKDLPNILLSPFVSERSSQETPNPHKFLFLPRQGSSNEQVIHVFLLETDVSKQDKNTFSGKKNNSFDVSKSGENDSDRDFLNLANESECCISESIKTHSLDCNQNLTDQSAIV